MFFSIYLLEDHNINHGCRNVLFLTAGLDVRAEIRKISAGAEDACIAFAAVQNHLLVENGDSFKFLSATVSDARLENQFDEEADIYGIKASVELYGIEADLCLRDAGVLYANRAGVFYDLLAEIGEKHLYVFKAVTVSARVKYSVGLYTNSFQAFAGAA